MRPNELEILAAWLSDNHIEELHINYKRLNGKTDKYIIKKRVNIEVKHD